MECEAFECADNQRELVVSLTRRGSSVCDSRFALGCPAYRFDPAHDKNPGNDTGDAQSRSDCEGPEEISGLLDDEPGEGWSDYAGEVRKAILRAIPSSHRFRARNPLTKCVDARSGNSIFIYAENTTRPFCAFPFMRVRHCRQIGSTNVFPGSPVCEWLILTEGFERRLKKLWLPAMLVSSIAGF